MTEIVRVRCPHRIGLCYRDGTLLRLLPCDCNDPSEVLEVVAVVPPTQPPAAKCDYCDQRATTLAGDTNGVLVCEGHVRLFAEREIAAALDHAERYPGYEKHKRHMLTSPPAVAPETETDANGWLAALTEAHRDSYPMGNIHHGTPENPDWGTFCVECKQSWPCDTSRLLECVRVVEGERQRWQDKAQEAGEAYANANSRHHEELDRANRLERLADRLAERAVELEDDAREATARAESAEAAHRALQAAVEALADEWEADFMAYRHDNPGHLRLRALLAGGEER